MSISRAWPLVLVVALGTAVSAAPEQDVSEVLYKLGIASAAAPDATPPRFVFGKKAMIAPSYKAALGGFDESGGFDGRTIGELGVAAWVGADYTFGQICGTSGCDPSKSAATAHALGLFVKVRDHWHPIAWQIARTVPADAQAAALGKHVHPDAFSRGVEPGARAVVRQLEAALKDGAELAKSVASRDDAVALGAEPGPRAQGAKAVRAALQKWPALKITSGPRAGTVAGGSVAWVAANVEATSGTHTPYRLLAIYLKDGTAWQLVAVQLAFVS